MIPSDKDIDPDVFKHFADVSSTKKSDSLTPPPPPMDFNEITRNFWLSRSSEIVKGYDLGSNAGKFAASTSQLRTENVFNTMFNALKTAVLNEIQQNGGKPSDYKDAFDAIQALFNILVDRLSTDETPTSKNNAERILAAIHGHLNSYVQSFYKNNKANEIYKL